MSKMRRMEDDIPKIYSMRACARTNPYIKLSAPLTPEHRYRYVL